MAEQEATMEAPEAPETNNLDSDIYSTRQLVTLMSEKGYDKKASKEAIQDIISCVKDSLLKGKTIKFINFGTFSSKIAEPREMINPLNKEKIMTKPRRQVRFKASSSMKSVD